jgi:hypothetical protein
MQLRCFVTLWLRVCTRTKWRWNRIVYEFFGISLSVSFHRWPSPYSYITWRMNNRLIGGFSSETLSRPIDMNNNKMCLELQTFPFILRSLLV